MELNDLYNVSRNEIHIEIIDHPNGLLIFSLEIIFVIYLSSQFKKSIKIVVSAFKVQSYTFYFLIRIGDIKAL